MSSTHDTPPVPRTLVLCFDGTGSHYESFNSIVLRFYNLLKGRDSGQQLIFYQTAIGATQFVTTIVRAVSKAGDRAVAWNLGTQIMMGYRFLVESYRKGDKICLFGFSRGAYVARALAGMVETVGLIPSPEPESIIISAYKIYKTGGKQSAEFKRKYGSIDVGIEFIGVWDTVPSVGLIPHRRPFTTSRTTVRTFRQALSLDEHRAKCKANHYHRPSDWEAPQPGTSPGSQTDVKEVWFAGCQYDIGKFTHEDPDRPSLARMPLRWMVHECFHTHTGILFDLDRFKEFGLDPDMCKGVACDPGLAQSQLSPPNPSPHQLEVRIEEDCEEVKDALCPMHDPLVHKPWWWILEFLPIEQRKQLPDNKWKTYHSINLGRGRTIPTNTGEFFVHKSVKTRMEHLGYKPKAKNWAKLKPVFVD